MPKKSNAQIKRMKKRAEARGEVYEAPAIPADETTIPTEGTTMPTEGSPSKSPPSGSEDSKRLQAARKLKQELDKIEKDETMKAKERRSAKRKAEAIGMETTGCEASDLLDWYSQQKDDKSEVSKKKQDKEKGRQIPYILFVGQLSYDTSKEALFQHIKTELGSDHKVNEHTTKIRILTDPKTKRSRGMAFIEVDNPELMYACLKLHHTSLDGRRINVERSAGGGKNSANRKGKLESYRTQQEEYMENTVKKMVDEYKSRGEIGDNELDDGVMALFKRHSGAVVEAALERYVESNGREMDNPSAYLTFLVGKLATEGIFHSEKNEKGSSGRPQKKQRSQ